MKCPNLKHPDAQKLIAKIGMFEFFKEYARNGYEIPDPDGYADSLQGVNASLKIVDAIASPATQKLFDKFYQKDPGKFFKELLQQGANKQQIQMLQDLLTTKPVDNLYDMAADVLAHLAYTVEMKTAIKDKEQGKSEMFIEEVPFPDFWEAGEGGPTVDYVVNQQFAGETFPRNIGTFESRSEAEAFMHTEQARQDVEELGKPTKHYEHMIVPGGVNYKEIEIRTPEISPTIKGHAAFATDKGIGWFRTDEADTNAGKVRRVLEMQSDLFQKGRQLKEISEPNLEDETVAAMVAGELAQVAHEAGQYPEGVSQYQAKVAAINQARATTAAGNILEIEENKNRNNFMQLLNDGSWVNFFIKSIVQDSVKKGFEKLRFPAGATASAIQQHTEVLQSIKNMDNNIDKWKANIIDLQDKLKLLPEGDEQLTKELQNANETLSNYESLRSEYDETEADIKAVKAYYEDRVQNILTKTYPTNRITDEHSNEWFEVALDKERDLSPISFYDNQPTPPAEHYEVEPDFINTAFQKGKDGLRHVYSGNSVLGQIGTPEAYSRYLDNIFPNSIVKDIVWRSGREYYADTKTPFVYFSKDREQVKNYNASHISTNSNIAERDALPIIQQNVLQELFDKGDISSDFIDFVEQRYRYEYKALKQQIPEAIKEYNKYTSIENNHPQLNELRQFEQLHNLVKIETEEDLIKTQQPHYDQALRDYQALYNKFSSYHRESPVDLIEAAIINLTNPADAGSDAMGHTDSYNQGYDGAISSDGNGILVSRTRGQVHMLGSNEDMHNFKEFVEGEEKRDMNSFFDNTMFKQEWNTMDTSLQQEEIKVKMDVFGGDYNDLLTGKLLWTDEMQGYFWNAAQKRNYTYDEYATKRYFEYQDNKQHLKELYDKIKKHNYLGVDANGNSVTSFQDLEAEYFKIMKFGNVEKELMGEVFMLIADKMTKYRVTEQCTLTARLNPELDPDNIRQTDLNVWDKIIHAKSDFNITHAGMQHISKETSQRMRKIEAEMHQTNLDLHMNILALEAAHYAFHGEKMPNEAKRAMLKPVKANEPFNWMYEKDRHGEYTQEAIKKNSAIFRNEVNIMNSQPGTLRGKLAEERIRFYEYLATTGYNLLKATGYEDPSPTNFLMPKLKMDFAEAYSRAGLFTAYIGLVQQDYNEVYNRIKVNYKGQTKRVDEWREELYKPTRGFIDKVKAPRDFNKILDIANDMIVNGETDVNAMELSTIVSSFANSNELPFRSLKKKDSFSINTHKALSSHFNALIFKKHMDPMVPTLHAISAYYKMSSAKNPEYYKNNLKFIENYADLFLFKRMDDMSNAPIAKVAEQVASAAILTYMGMAVKSSTVNVLGGFKSGMMEMIGEEGWVEGPKKYMRGMKRLFGGNLFAKWGRMNNFLFDEKASAILEYYKINNFTRSESEGTGEFFNYIRNKLLFITENSEILIRGIPLMAEFTQEQLDAFDYNYDTGELRIVPGKKNLLPTEETVNRWKYDISKELGNVDPENRRGFHRNVFMKAAFLLKGSWIIDYFQNRWRKEWYDENGRKREGYYRTLTRLISDHKMFIAKMQGQEKFTPLEQKNLRKVIFDLMVKSAFVLMNSSLGGESEQGRKYRKWLASLNSQMFLFMSPKEMLGLAKDPFAALGIIEKALTALDYLTQLELTKAGKSAAQLIPGHQVVEDVYGTLNPNAPKSHRKKTEE